MGPVYRRFLHRRKRPACILKLGLVRLPVHQALAFHTFHGGDGPINVAAPESDAVIVSELELGRDTLLTKKETRQRQSNRYKRYACYSQHHDDLAHEM
jgi:hypothetical protein